MTIFNLTGQGGPKKKKVAILGAGLAGLAAAWRLSQVAGHDIVIIEKENFTGGLAASTAFAGARFDLGSHRIHPGYPGESLRFIKILLKEGELLTRPRDGTLVVNRWRIPYPLSPVGMLRAIGPVNTTRFALSWGYGAFRKLYDRYPDDSYERYLSRDVGSLAYKTFHAPYAKKVYGINPGDISARAANVRADSIIPFRWPAIMGKRRNNFFHYPSNGFGAIAQGLLSKAIERGVKVVTGTTVTRLAATDGMIKDISYSAKGSEHTSKVDAVISTIPVGELVASILPHAPKIIMNAAQALRFRGIRLVQMIIAKNKFLKGDTFYFPEGKYIFGRISEPKCFSPAMCQGDNITSLNIEVILTPGGRLWKLDHQSFLKLVINDMKKVFTFSPNDITESRSILLSDVYPVYDRPFRLNLGATHKWLDSFANLRSIGRGGMFFHGNADHSIDLGLKTAEMIAGGKLKESVWSEEDIEACKVRV